MWCFSFKPDINRTVAIRYCIYQKKPQINKWPTVSLAIQELHDWLQYVVSILGYAAGISHIWGALHLSQDISHLLHILFYMRLEALAEKHRKH